MSIKMEVWGDYACFTRPEMKVERVSYDVPTPSAARGMVESVYYHPGLKWHVDKIYVCKPIRFTNILRNEVASKISASNVPKPTARSAPISTETPIFSSVPPPCCEMCITSLKRTSR